MRKNKKLNYLDMTPVRNPKLDTQQEDTGLATLSYENKGAFNRVAQKLLRKPKVSYVHLDELGSFVWLHIDGQSTVGGIAAQVQQHFGDKADPLYPRLVQYFQNLEQSDLITLSKPGKSK
jgi:hypothetical protein